MSGGARKKKACEALGFCLRTVQRWEKKPLGDERRHRLFEPLNKLSNEEEERIYQLLISVEYRDRPPEQIVADLADKGVYIASEASMYRILRKRSLMTHRLRSAEPRPRKKPEEYKATGPNEVWTWDITVLPTQVRGHFLYLYMIVDIYSRKIVAWTIHEAQNAELASDLARLAHAQEAPGEALVLHSDNGSPMKGATMLATLQQLGIIPSFSRPSVSNDNAFSESLFRTLKYRPTWPEGRFESIGSAREWVSGFVQWYNYEHRHSAIKYVTPNQRHMLEDKAILRKRDALYKRQREINPTRWSRETRNWSHINLVTLNPTKESKAKNCQVIEALPLASGF